MIELLSNPFVDFVSRVALPGLSVLVAIVTLVVLRFALRLASRTLTRSVIPQIECYLRARPVQPHVRFRDCQLRIRERITCWFQP